MNLKRLYKQAICFTLSILFLMNYNSVTQSNAVYASAPYDYDISEYIIESEHIIIDGSICEYLPSSVPPAAFNLFMQRLDTYYDMFSDLTGQIPYDGIKINISCYNFGNPSWIAKASRDKIYWNTEENNLSVLFNNISRNRSNYWKMPQTPWKLKMTTPDTV